MRVHLNRTSRGHQLSSSPSLRLCLHNGCLQCGDPTRLWEGEIQVRKLNREKKHFLCNANTYYDKAPVPAAIQSGFLLVQTTERISRIISRTQIIAIKSPGFLFEYDLMDINQKACQSMLANQRCIHICVSCIFVCVQQYY